MQCIGRLFHRYIPTVLLFWMLVTIHMDMEIVPSSDTAEDPTGFSLVHPSAAFSRMYNRSSLLSDEKRLNLSYLEGQRNLTFFEGVAPESRSVLELSPQVAKTKPSSAEENARPFADQVRKLEGKMQSAAEARHRVTPPDPGDSNNNNKNDALPPELQVPGSAKESQRLQKGQPNFALGLLAGRSSGRRLLKANPKPNVVLPGKLSHQIDQAEIVMSEEEIASIRQLIEALNDNQQILNVDAFGPVTNTTTIFLVQVHKRLENLKYLVNSMTKVEGIGENALVIFSHDFWDESINAFVMGITAFRVMQMFFPFSIQLHPFSFPGRDNRDCVWNFKREDPIRCNNKPWPDSFGHFREAGFTQIKHHWWWKIRRVFEDLKFSQSWNGWALFLEEDHYLSPDSLQVLQLLLRDKDKLCPTCGVVALGNYKFAVGSQVGNKVDIGDWIVSQHNMGFALGRSAWNRIKECNEQFCTFDDYNWDWTMNRMVQICCVPKLTMMSVTLSRVAHVGSCGTHIKKTDCDVSKEVARAEAAFRNYKHLLFPKSFSALRTYRRVPLFKNPNGGWGDYRDRQLCRAIGNGTANQQTIERLQFPDRMPSL